MLDKKPSYDPLVEIINYYAAKKPDSASAQSRDSQTVEERLKNRIIDGEKKGLEDDLRSAMEKYPPLEIINSILLSGMKVVGELFGKGEMQLPFVLQSAEVMKAAVAFLEPFMEKEEGSQKGTIILATVKGDVHDIGKNLVDIILTNNGYKVINLGIKCPIDTMLNAYDEHKANAIGMSGLLVKSTLIMKENLELMKSRGLKPPVLLGGAALTRRYVEEDLGSMYEGAVFYCEDAFSGLHVMEKIASGESLKAEPTQDPLTMQADSIAETIKRIRIVRHQWNKALDYVSDQDFEKIAFGEWSLHDILAHFVGWENKTIERLKSLDRPETIRECEGDELNSINSTFVKSCSALSRLEIMDLWNEAQKDLMQQISSMKESDLSIVIHSGPVAAWISDCTFAHEYSHLQKVHAWIQSHQIGGQKKSSSLQRSKTSPSKDIPIPPFWGSKIIENISLETINPFINEIALFRGQWQFTRGKMSSKEYDGFVDEKVRPVFEHWKTKAVAEKLLVPKVTYGYFPCQADGNDVIIFDEKTKKERLRFSFPRQEDGHFYCIADFFSPVDSGKMDVLGCMLVTVGQQASDFSETLFKANDYANYLYFHGLSVETAEALAEYWHRQIRAELGFVQNDSADIKRLFQQSYRGSRYSFGYPACPNLEDQTKLFELLDPGRIGVSLTEEFHLIPEQSTSAIIVHHPEAKYFNI